MAIIRCPHGHFYDDGKHDSCPLCQGKQAGGPVWRMDEEKTVCLDRAQEQTVQLTPAAERQASVRGSWDAERTVSLSSFENGRLLTGWLVCTEGSGKGQDFRLYAGFNRIGRDWDADICIQDPEVGRENHCSVVYDEKSRIFYLVPGQGTMTYLNGEVVQNAVRLEEMIPFTVGGSTLELVPFCKGEHVWKTGRE